MSSDTPSATDSLVPSLRTIDRSDASTAWILPSISPAQALTAHNTSTPIRTTPNTFRIDALLERRNTRRTSGSLRERMRTFNRFSSKTGIDSGWLLSDLWRALAQVGGSLSRHRLP